MPTYADLSGWVISIIADRFEVIAGDQIRQSPWTQNPDSELLFGAPRCSPCSIKVDDHCGDDHSAGDESLHRFLGPELCQSGFQEGDHEHPEEEINHRAAATHKACSVLLAYPSY